jgi:hypothetical protein
MRCKNSVRDNLSGKTAKGRYFDRRIDTGGVSMRVDVLGTKYEVIVKKYGEDEAFARRHIDGYCDHLQKKIVICDMTSYDGWEHEPKETAEIAQKQTLRHEIIHAFLCESGLSDSGLVYDGAWCKNEELVDWIAWQGEKLYKAWEEADAL